MFFVRVQVKTRLVPGFRASYVEARDLITARATKNAVNAKGPGNQPMAFHARVAEAWDKTTDLKLLITTDKK